MPELPEVEAIRRSLFPLVGLKVVKVTIRRPTLRYPIPASMKKALIGCYLVDIVRCGKYLLWNFDSIIMTSHLGMSGRFTISQNNTFAKHDHVIWKFSDSADSTFNLVYNDTRRFGYISIKNDFSLAKQDLNLGPEALSKDFSEEYILGKTKNCNRNIKTLLLDQKFVAGIGNIYASESLWHSSISPFRIAKSITKKEALSLTKAVQSTLLKAISANGTTLQDYQNARGEKGLYHTAFVAYSLDDTICQKHNCGGNIVKKMQNGRVSYFCQSHQI